ncbi:MAG: hypothetical protein JSW07_04555 [bacterium]|nr:MAG: hypothetical protein JSW07_04555 [bacterium]
MVVESRSDLKLTDRLEILCHLLRGEKIGPLIDNFNNHGVSGFQKFVWEKTVEFGIVCRGKNFDRKEITRKMTPTPVFQLQQRCAQHVYNCKGIECIHTNSKCARKKIKEHVDAMAESIQEYIKIVKKRELV